MKTKTLHKALSMLLTAAMVLNMGLTPVFAEGVAIGASGLSDCHTAHDSECGYSETVQMGGCTHAHDGDCGFTEGTEEQPCAFIADEDAEASPSDADEHSHDDTCGYAPATEGTPCTHEHDDVCGYGETVTVTPCAHICEVCKAVDSDKPAEKVCTCGAVDSGNLPQGELVHSEDCPLYTAPERNEAVKALIAMVDALPNVADITEENKEATQPAFEAAAMAYGELQGEDKAAFEQTSQYTKLMALREVLYPIAMMADSPVTLDISGVYNYVKITATGYTVGTATETAYIGDYIITGSTEITNAESNHVMVSGGTHNITLTNADIQIVEINKCAFAVEGNSSVNLTLGGKNVLGSGVYRAGLEVKAGNTITIGGAGTLTATGGYKGAGIGGGRNGAGGTININGGTVTATGNDVGAGIGGGQNGAGGTITITDNAVVFATKGSDASNHIGAGSSGSEGTVSRDGGIIFEGDAGKVYGNFTIGTGQTLTIPTGKTLTVPENVTLTNNGRLKVLGTTDGDGTLDGDGVMQMALKDSMIALDKNSYVYTGQQIIPTVSVAPVTLWDKTFNFVKDTDYAVTVSNNIAVGTSAKVIVKPNSGDAALTGSPVDKTFTITQSGTEFTGGVKTYKDEIEQTTFIYGDTITVKVTPTAAPKTRAFTEPQANQLALYKGDVQLTEPKTVTSGIELTFTINTADKQLAIGENTITAKYVAGADMAGQSGTVDITLNKKPLTATVNTGDATATKAYDGTAGFTGVALTLTDAVSGDMITATASGTADNANAGSAKVFTATTTPTLTGTDAAYYSLDQTQISGNVAITAATPSVKVTAVKQEKSLLRSVIGDHNDTILLTATTKGVNDEKPNGQVEFKNGATTLATKPTTDGVATYEWKNPPTGNYTITAEFTASDSNYISTAVIGTADGFEISKGAQADLAVVVPTLTYGDTGKSLSTTGGSGTGTVTYTVTGDGCVTVGGTGAITVVKVGTAKVTATKAEDANFNSITSEEKTIDVNPATPTVAWASDTQTLTYTGAPALITPPTVTLVNSEPYSGEITYTYTAPARLSNLFGLFAGESDTLPKDVGVYEVTAHIAANGNYTEAVSDKMTLTITKSTPTLAITTMTGKAYDGRPIAPPTEGNMAITGVAYNKVTFAYSASSDMSGSTQTPPTNAGTYYVQASVAEGDNTAAADSAAVSFTISQAPLTINGGTVTSKKYDSTTTATVTALTFVGLQNGEALEIATDYTVGTPMFDTAAVGDGKTVTGTAALVENAKTKNYSLTGTFANVKGNITLADGPAAPTNGVVNDNKGTDTYTFTPVSGITEANKYEYSTNSGSSWTNATVNPIVIGNIAVPVGALQVRVKATATHNAGAVLSNDTKFTASIEGSVAIAGTATYGETLTATATGTQTGAVLSYEWKTNDGTILQAKSASSTYKIAGAAVGSTITVEVTAAGYDGKLDATTAAVAKKNLTVTATAQNKEYDGGIDATVRFTFGTGEVVSGDSVTVTATTKFGTKGVGIDKTVNITDFKLDGAEKDNYTVTTPPTTATASITTKALTVSDGTLVITKEYDTAATFAAGNTTGTLAIESVVGDTVSVKIDSYGVADSANVGTKTISLGISLEGTDKGNYTIASPYSFTKATIKTKTITPTIDAIAAVDYNGTAKEPALTVKDGETTLTSGTDYTAVYSNNTNAGVNTGSVIVKAKADGNYSFTDVTATFTIKKASGLNATTPNNLLMIKQQKKEYTFDLSTIALDKTDTGARTYALGALTNSNDIFETIPSITGNEMRFTSKSIVSPATNQATQVVTISTQNYEDVSVTLSFDITNKTPVTISGLTAATGLVYNGSPQKGYTGTAAFSPTWSGTLTYTYYKNGTKLSGAPTNAGTYTVVASIPDSDTTYEGSHADITFTIGQKEITVTAGTYTVSKSYDGTTAAGTDSGALKATGILPADSGVTVAPRIIPAYSGSAVKSDYEIILPIIISGDTNSNYNLAANTVTVPGKITRATVTATIDAIAAVDYTGSQIKPTVTVKVNGSAIADANYTVVYGANINAGTDAGSVTVKAKADGNYSFTDVTANFTINKIAYAGTAITGNKYVVQNKVETGAQFDLASLSFPAGFKDKAFASVAIGTNTDGLITGTPSISGTKVVFDVASIEKGKTGVLNVAVKSTNYNDYTVAITVTTVEKTPVAITGLTAQTNLSYNGAPQKGYTGNVAVEGNKVPTNELVYTYTSTDGGYNDTTPPTNAGDYKLVVSIADSNTDFIGSHADILFTIGKKAVTVNADNQTMVKNGTLPTFTVSCTGFVGTENEGNAALATAAVAGCTADGKTVGNFEITLTTQAILNATVGKNYNITEQKGGTLTVSEITHGITASAGTGGTISPIGTVTVTDGASQTFTITANSSYSIDSVTVDGASQGAISTYTFSNVTGNHTISATFSYNGGGGGGSTGGGGNSGGSTTPTTPPAITDPTLPENGNVNLKPSVDKDGNATVTVSDKNIADAIKKAQDEAKKNGTEKNGIAVTITIDTNKTLNSFTANLPKSTQEKLIAAGVTTLTINGGAKLTFDLEAIKQIKTTANTDVVVTATKTANSALSKEAQAATGGRPVYDFKVTGGGKNITTFGNGKLSLSIPYELQKVDGNGKPSATGSFENPGNLVGVYIDANGKLTYLPGSSYNATSKTMLISTTHLSVYGVAYKTNAPTFTDTATHWAKDDIQFVAARGLLTGTTATTFSPNTSMTRGMFVTALGRLAGIDTNSYKTGSFTDVKTDVYYAPYVNWAVQNNIVTGTSTTTFAPDSAITRQEMAVMTANYAKAIGYKLPSVHKEIIFTDSASIGTWAKSAVKEMQMAGILMGKDGGKFDPTGTATRAEVSAMLRRFVELVANSETAEGWVTNDSGNWMYFDNGKAVTGKKKIDGTTYEFDQYGVTAILPKDRRFTLYTVQKGDSFWAIASKYKVNIFELVSLNGKNIFSTIHPGDELKIPQK